jgi:hypothetical protein
MPHSYEAPWMYQAPREFAAWNASSSSFRFLRQQRPSILHLPTISLSLPSLAPIAGPASLGPPASAKLFNTFNPAIARAPRNLCSRCKYLVAMRVDPLHQVRPCALACIMRVRARSTCA